MSTYFAHLKKIGILSATLITLFLVVFPICVLADTTIITNSVKASASSGGNTASGNGGQIVTGETEVDIFIETIVNGETVEYIDEYYKGSDIPDGGIHKETHYESEDKTVVVDTDIEVNADSVDNNTQFVGDAGDKTAAVIEAVAKIEDQLEKTEEMALTKISDISEKEQINNVDTENEKEVEKIGLISFISNNITNSITNLFKYVLSIFA